MKKLIPIVGLTVLGLAASVYQFQVKAQPGVQSTPMNVPSGPPAENPKDPNLRLPPVSRDLPGLKPPENSAADIGEKVAMQRAIARAARYGERNPSVIRASKMRFDQARQLKPEPLFPEQAELSDLPVYIVEMQGTFQPLRGRPPAKPGSARYSESAAPTPIYTYKKAYLLFRAADGASLGVTLLNE